MASHILTYIILLSGSLAAFKSSDKAAIKYIKLLFFFCAIWLIHLCFCSLEGSPGRYEVASIMTDGSILLFLFVPASNIYLRNRFYEQPFTPADWNGVRPTLVKFVSQMKSFMQTKGAAKQTARTRISHSSFLTKERVSQIELRVRKHFEEKKPYLQPGYSLQMLSDETRISVHHLSAFINEYYKLNFNNFINEHRVVICMEKLLHNEWQVKKLEAIAQECGFNNRNTFTSAFKKTTGVNPSEFLQQIKLKNSKSVLRDINQGGATLDNGSTMNPFTHENIA